MKIEVLYDNNSCKEGMLSGWGFSCFVGGRVLFDTGEDGERLVANMERSGISAEDVEAVVISHDHWDHTGGLREVLENRPGIKVYGCPGFSAEFRNSVKRWNGELAEPSGFKEISGNIYVTDVVTGEYKARPIEERALAVKTSNGISVITGCAHPGIVRMVGSVKERFPGEDLYCVLGGFHLHNDGPEGIGSVIAELEALGVKKAGPSHCSGEEAEQMFAERFGDRFVEVSAGKVIEV